ncbi:MAG TPA: ribonuclease III [Mycobacteriales bacterium]|jgi:ribonuclease-3|nr:ribonuclease III [Mycobacteriales bacterium]
MPEGSELSGLIEALGGEVDIELVNLAVTHRSYAYENGGVPTNERLEFLGDSVLGVIVTEELYRRFPDLAEGQLAKLRAAVVNARALAGVGRTIGLGAYLKLGRGEETTGGRDKSSILADALEAVIGAYYLDRGLEPTRALVLALFATALEEAAGLGAGLDWKTSLQELAAERGLGAPEYAVDESGPDHAKSFRATALLGGSAVGQGEGNSKKEAEQRAAEQAWTSLTSLSDVAVPDGA